MLTSPLSAWRGRGAWQGISKDLITRAFPADDRPDYITSADFYRFTPDEEFMNLPGDISRTEFRLVVTHEGWEYTVLGRELGAHRDPERKMLVTVGAVNIPGAPQKHDAPPRCGCGSNHAHSYPAPHPLAGHRVREHGADDRPAGRHHLPDCVPRHLGQKGVLPGQ